MSDEEFSAFLAACRQELAEKQRRFQQRWGIGTRWEYDLADCSLTVGVDRLPMIPIGTHSPQFETWLWAWANDDFPAAAREVSRRLQGLNSTTGFRVFLDAGIPASSADAQDFTAMAVHYLGSIGFFRAPSNGPTLYLAVFEPACENRAQ